MEMLQMLEHMQKYALIREWKIFVLSFLLIADSDRQEHLMECDEILVTCVLYCHVLAR
jgi:uncharacterized membrane protein YfhO